MLCWRSRSTSFRPALEMYTQVKAARRVVVSGREKAVSQMWVRRASRPRHARQKVAPWRAAPAAFARACAVAMPRPAGVAVVVTVARAPRQFEEGAAAQVMFAGTSPPRRR